MCKDPIDFERLAAYWLGELPDAEGALEEHLFACAHCSARLEWLAALSHGVRAALRDGRVAATITPAFLEALRRQGLRIREYRVPAGARADCTLLAGEHAVVGRMQAALAGVQRIDTVKRLEVAGKVTETRAEDVPFDPAAGEVLFMPSAVWLRNMPASTVRVRLLAVEETGERVLGEYTFAHTPGG
jgi:anti-sigma factor RsiW